MIGRMIIPAAGWGRRVGSPASKELWPHPRYPQQSYLSVAVALAEQLQLKPLVLSRDSKKELNQWLHSSLSADEFLIMPETREWVDTLLGSAAYWETKNILFLPDAWFEPAKKALQEIVSALDDVEWAWGMHQVPLSEVASWGVLLSRSKEWGDSLWASINHKERGGDEFHPIWAWEKPSSLSLIKGLSVLGAWGVLGFRGTVQAYQFWRAYEKTRYRQTPVLVPGTSFIVSLSSFIDGTRGA